MGRINVLPRRISELIAAGEVVERPSSVVKEIMENSIDAGAKNITLEIKHGGITFIRITDDGCGMDGEDVKKAFISHATSKIAAENDLNSIGTLGFRGEAIPSIAAVSKVEVMSRPCENEIGVRYVVEGGEEKEFSEAGCPAGTTIIIRDIFYNTPARMKFLKKDVSEGNSVAGVVDRIALSHPEVSVRFIRDGKQQLLTPGSGKLTETIYAVFGREFSSSLLPVDYDLNGVKVKGYISKPVNSRANRAMQFFFLNGRLVKSVTAVSALENAYRDSVMVGKFPACVLHISVPANLVDVNVHPAKIEVRFANEKQVYEAVYYGAKSTLSKDFSKPEVALASKIKAQSLIAPPAFEEKGEQIRMTAAEYRNTFSAKPKEAPKKEEAFHYSPKPAEKAESRFAVNDNKNSGYGEKKEYSGSTLGDYYRKKAQAEREKSAPAKAPEPTAPSAEKKAEAVSVPEKKETFKSEGKPDIIPERKTEPTAVPVKEEPKAEVIPEPRANEPEKMSSFRIVGEAFKTYIIVECEGELLIVDKHAAHERMIYEELKANTVHFGQILLKPVTVTLSKEEYSVITENLSELSKAGFLVEDFGSGTVIVRECPMDLDGESIADIICELAEGLSSNKIDVRTGKTDWLYHSVACRAAIKAGDSTSPYEMEKFIGKLLKNENIKYCPHGRPVMIKMTRNELEKTFGRIQ